MVARLSCGSERECLRLRLASLRVLSDASAACCPDRTPGILAPRHAARCTPRTVTWLQGLALMESPALTGACREAALRTFHDVVRQVAKK